MRTPTLTQRLEALAALREPSRLRLYQYVERQAAGVSRDQAAAAVGISRAMAAFHLDRLVEAGFLRAHYRRLSGRTGRGAGRPSKLYRRSRREFGVTLPVREHELLARVLVRAFGAQDPFGAMEADAYGVGLALGRRARTKVRSGAPPSRLASCVKDVLDEIGFEPVPMDSGGIRARNCPFDPLSRTTPEVVCRAAHAIARGVIDAVQPDVLNLHRDPQPDQCCVVLAPGPTPPRGAS